MRKLCGAFVLSVATSAAAHGAVNVLLNGQFLNNADDWDESDGIGSVTWASEGHGGLTGSAILSSTDPASLSYKTILQCRRAVEGETYDARAWFFIPSENLATGYGQLFVSWYADSNCSNSAIDGSGAAIVSAFDQWTLREINGQVAPPGTIRAVVVLQLTKNNAGASFVLRVDDAELLLHPYFADGFETGNTGAWSDVAP